MIYEESQRDSVLFALKLFHIITELVVLGNTTYENGDDDVSL